LKLTRKLVAGTGLRNSPIWPAQVFEVGRRFGLIESVIRLKAEPKDDGGGVYEQNWVKQPISVRARFDQYKRGQPKGPSGGKLMEFVDLFVTVEAGSEIVAPDRLERVRDNTLYEVIDVMRDTGVAADEGFETLRVKQVEADL
jgi:hypothetical protein